MISQTAEYALRAVVFLAYEADSKTTQQIADATKVPAGYLSKVLQNLVRSGLVQSVRGIGGGYLLAKRADKITVWEVVDSVDPIQRIHTCPLDIKSHGSNLCPMHRRLDDAAATVEKAFRRSTIGELIKEPNSSKPLCEFPSQPLRQSDR